MTLKKWIVALGLVGAVALNCTGQAEAAIKIGVMHVQKIVALSDAGKKAKGRFEAKMKELQAKFKAEQEGVIALQKEIEKKSSAWSEQKKADKAREFQKLRRELQTKNEDANFELKNLQDKELQPILKTLEKVVNDYGKKQGYSAIFDSKSGVVYFDKSIDVTDALVKELNKAMKK